MKYIITRNIHDFQMEENYWFKILYTATQLKEEFYTGGQKNYW